MSCRGLAISLPIVRKGLNPITFKKFWQKLYSGEMASGRPCPVCRKPLSEVEADGNDGAVLIDICRTCHLLWFDDKEFSDLPKIDPKEKPGSELTTKADRAFAEFKEDQFRRRSFLMKLLDGTVAKEIGFDRFFGD
jgi:Zn-finger nucleic acid-binding protein